MYLYRKIRTIFLLIYGIFNCTWKPRFLGKIAQYVSAAAMAATLDKKASYRLRLAVDEIATNIIVHVTRKQGWSGK